MMIRKIWWFLWYQNHNNFEKNEKRKDQATLNAGMSEIPVFNNNIDNIITLNHLCLGYCVKSSVIIDLINQIVKSKNFVKVLLTF